MLLVEAAEFLAGPPGVGVTEPGLCLVTKGLPEPCPRAGSVPMSRRKALDFRRCSGSITVSLSMVRSSDDAFVVA
ncbi:hypothetical protein ABMX48_00085 [Streptomyces cavourensis]